MKKHFLKKNHWTSTLPSNSLETKSDYQNAVNYLYNQVRFIMWGGINADTQMALRYATDFAVNATDYSPAAKLNDYKNTMVPTFFVPENMWLANYGLISNANVIIDHAKASKKLSDAEKTDFVSQALFFRALTYRLLANLFGGVPLILEEVLVPRRDYVRATRAEVYTQCKKDLIEAIAGLDNIDKVKNGKVNKQVARHLLAEIYISLNMQDEAITTASQVINDPLVGLMKDRFGSRKN